MKEAVAEILVNRKGWVAEPMVADAVIRGNNEDIIKTVNLVMRVITRSGCYSSARIQQERLLRNIIVGMLKLVSVGSVDLNLVRDTMKTILQELPQPVVRLRPLALSQTKEPLLPPVEGEQYTLVLDLDETLVHFVEVEEWADPDRVADRGGRSQFDQVPLTSSSAWPSGLR